MDRASARAAAFSSSSSWSSLSDEQQQQQQQATLLLHNIKGLVRSVMVEVSRGPSPSLALHLYQTSTVRLAAGRTHSDSHRRLAYGTKLRATASLAADACGGDICRYQRTRKQAGNADHHSIYLQCHVTVRQNSPQIKTCIKDTASEVLTSCYSGSYILCLFDEFVHEYTLCACF